MQALLKPTTAEVSIPPFFISESGLNRTIFVFVADFNQNPLRSRTTLLWTGNVFVRVILHGNVTVPPELFNENNDVRRFVSVGVREPPNVSVIVVYTVSLVSVIVLLRPMFVRRSIMITIPTDTTAFLFRFNTFVLIFLTNPYFYYHATDGIIFMFSLAE
jgi:hypothetical protein